LEGFHYTKMCLRNWKPMQYIKKRGEVKLFFAIFTQKFPALIFDFESKIC